MGLFSKKEQLTDPDEIADPDTSTVTRRETDAVMREIEAIKQASAGRRAQTEKNFADFGEALGRLEKRISAIEGKHEKAMAEVVALQQAAEHRFKRFENELRERKELARKETIREITESDTSLKRIGVISAAITFVAVATAVYLILKNS